MKSSFKNERLDAVKFCFGISPNLCEGGLSFLIEEDVKLDSFANKFWTNFLKLANASRNTFPNLMGSIPRNMKLVFGSSDSQEELDRIFDAFNHFSQVFQNVCEEVFRETSSKDEKQNLKKALDGEQYSLKQIVKLNFIPDKSLNKRFDVFKKKFASYLGNDYDYEKNSKERPPILQKLIAAVIDAFVANPTSAAGTDKNLKLIFGGRIASDLMYRDLSNLTVGQFRKGYQEFIDEYNLIATNLMVPKMENPENILDSGEPGSGGESGSGAESSPSSTGSNEKGAEDKKDAEPGGAEDKKDAEPGGAEDKKDAEPGGQTLSSLLFTRVDNNDLSKGYKAKRDEPGSKSSSIKQNLANLTATMTDIDPSGDLNKPSSINKKGRKQMMTYLSRLHKDLDGIKIESKLSDSEIILERWNRLAGLEN